MMRMTERSISIRAFRFPIWLLGVLAVLWFAVQPVHAEQETETAGASLGKDRGTEESMTRSHARAVEGWVQVSGGRWRYRYSDGKYAEKCWLKINGAWYYFDSSGYWVDDNTHESGSLKGIDVSAWQGKIDWQAVKNDGVQFAFVRIGHGEHVLDTYYSQNMKGAQEAGIPVGVYMYSTAKNEAEAIADAQFVIRNMEGYLVSYPVVIDLEDKSQDSLSKYQLGRIAKVFCDEVRAAGYTPMLYCNENWYKNRIDVSQITDVEKWIARWNVRYDTSIPRGIWQSGIGRVNGIPDIPGQEGKANVDVDFGYIDYTQIVTPRTRYADGYRMTGGTWVKDRHGWWYNYYTGGYPAQAWELIGGAWYWFDSNGYMATGWRNIDGTWYYLTSSGAMATGWVLVGNTWYYLSGSGAMLTGFQTIGNAVYYLDESGAMATGWRLMDGTWYYFHSSGAMATGWMQLGNWYYLDPTDGKMAVGFKTVGDAVYYLDESGAMATGWRLVDGVWYYFHSSGAMATGWMQSGNWYYLDPADGKMAVGFKTVGDAVYYMTESGAMVTGWRLVDDTWYYFEASGAMVTGWLQLGDVRYYLAEDGKMLTGIQTIDEVEYEFDTSGACIS